MVFLLIWLWYFLWPEIFHARTISSVNSGLTLLVWQISWPDRSQCRFNVKILHCRWEYFFKVNNKSFPWLTFSVCVCVGGGGGGGGCNLGVILVRVYESVFQNLPDSYIWPLKKRTRSYTWSSKMLTYSYTALWFLYPFLLVITQISQSMHVIPRR